jgi:hypothetical protein
VEDRTFNTHESAMSELAELHRKRSDAERRHAELKERPFVAKLLGVAALWQVKNELIAINMHVLDLTLATGLEVPQEVIDQEPQE